MKSFWTLWEDLNNAANQPASQNDANPEKKKEFKQLELLPTKDFDVREKARKEVGDGFNILKDNIPGPVRKRMETALGSDDLDTIQGVGDQMASMRLQHPLMDVINDRGRGERHQDSEVLKRFNKIQDLKQQGGSKKELSPFFKMKQELKGGSDGFVEKMMEQFPNIDVSQSSEIMADMRGEDGLQSNDVLHHFLPEISEAMGDLPANLQDQFSNYLQKIQYRYKTGGDYGSLIDELLDYGFDEGDEYRESNREFNGINTKWGGDEINNEDENIEKRNGRLKGGAGEGGWGRVRRPKKREA